MFYDSGRYKACPHQESAIELISATPSSNEHKSD
jgi:hypothetical protein